MDMRKLQHKRWRWIGWLVLLVPLQVIVIEAVDRRLPTTSDWHILLLVLAAILVNLGFAAAFGWLSHR